VTAPGLDGRRLRSADDDVLRTFGEHDGEVWAVYHGGDVSRGYLVGTRTGDHVEFRFDERATDGTTSCGRGSFDITTAEGGLQLRETWALESGPGEGTKLLTEVMGATC
jgi:hypothetical protein